MENVNDMTTAVEKMRAAFKALTINDFNVYFCVIDTKGTPSSYVEYIYNLALNIKKLGFNVSMLHYEEDFVGVGGWLGEKYADLPHYNVNKKNVTVGPSDFIFIPEMYVSIMTKLKDIPAKKIVIIQDYKYLTEFLPIGQTFDSFKIHDAIVTSEQLGKKVNEFFPGLHMHIITPVISEEFHKSDKPQKMTVNIVSKEQGNVNRIVKPFYWKYNQFQWVSFADCRNMTQSLFAQSLRDCAICVWIDDLTPYGTACLEALRSGTIVLAKVPDVIPEWARDKEGKLTDHILWFDDVDATPDLVAGVVGSWIKDKVPASVYEEQATFDYIGHPDTFYNEVASVFRDHIYNKRMEDFKETIAYAEKQNKEEA